MIYGMRIFLPGQLPLGQLPSHPIKSPKATDRRTFPSGKVPLDLSPWTTTPRKTSSYKTPPKKITLQTFALWIITLK